MHIVGNSLNRAQVCCAQNCGGRGGRGGGLRGQRGERERERQERKTETGWTVHYTPGKGQSDVLFMSLAVAVAVAAASGAKVEMSTRHCSPEPTVAQAASHQASRHASWLLLTMSKHTHNCTHTHTGMGGTSEGRLSITLNRSVLIFC